MFSVRFSLIIVVVFLLNMMLRELKIEPYPTLLLPDRPSTITKDEDNRIKVNSTELYALDIENRWSKVNRPSHCTI